MSLTKAQAKMLTEIHAKVMKVSANPFSSSSSTQVAPSAPVVLPPQWNLYPEPGIVYEHIPPVPAGYHLEYDYANHVASIFKTCGPLGGS